MTTNPIRKKTTGETGNGGEFGTHTRDADTIELTPADLIARRDAASAAYYEGESDLTDEEFDQLTAELKAFGIEESVGHGYVPEGRVAHDRPMLSLAKVRTEDEIRRFVERTPGAEYQIELKYDGLAISLVYEDGELARATTRGNGKWGKDVTYAVKQMSVPTSIGNEPGRNEVRGEVMLDQGSFEQLNAEFEGKYSNPRNAAAGILSRQSGEEARYLTLTVHDGGGFDDEALHALGFTTSSTHFAKKATDVASIMDAVAEIDGIRGDLAFDTDGVVIKVIDPAMREQLGEGSSSPAWAVAFKFASEIKQTVLRGVKWQLGRTGKLTPVAEFDTIVLAGANVSQATLHNRKFIDDMDLRIGDTIEVTRSGEVIPYVIGKVADGENRTAVSDFTEYVGRDGNTYPVEHDDINIRVVGYLDPATVVTYGIKTLGILGVAEALVTKLVDAGHVSTLPDMLGVTAEQIMALDRQGQKSAENAVKAIHDGLEGATVAKWFASIGLHGMGNTTGRVLEKKFGTLDSIAAAEAHDLIGLEGFGDITTSDFLAARPRIKALADQLRDEQGYEPKSAAPVKTVASSYTGLNVVLTGTFPTLGRTAAGAAVERLGGNVRSSVSASTDLLIAGDAAGSKLTKAQSLGVRILTATAFEAEVTALS